MPHAPRGRGWGGGAHLLLLLVWSAGSLSGLALKVRGRPLGGVAGAWAAPSPTAAAAAAEQARDALRSVLASQAGAFVLLNAMASSAASAFVLTKAVFLGVSPLTAVESAALAERLLRFVAAKAVFVGAVVGPSPDDIATFLSWFCYVGCLKALASLARDRGEALLASPRATAAQHARCAALLAGVLAQAAGLARAYGRTMPPRRPGASALGHYGGAALWLYDAWAVGAEAAHAAARYAVAGAEAWRAARAEAAAAAGKPAGAPAPWAGRAAGEALYTMELAFDTALSAAYLAHCAHLYAHLVCARGPRAQLPDALLLLEARRAAGAAAARLRRHGAYLRAAAALDRAFADAPRGGGGGGGGALCAICIEPAGAARAKLLPCGHPFHVSCLRGWLQHAPAPACPLCRAPLLVAGGGAAAPPPPREARAPARQRQARQAPPFSHRACCALDGSSDEGEGSPRAGTGAPRP